MNLFIKERWVHLLVYACVVILFTAFAVEHLDIKNFMPYEIIPGKFIINLVIWGSFSICWEMYWGKFDKVDIYWSLVGITLGVILHLIFPRSTVLLWIAAIIALLVIAAWAQIKYNYLKLKK